MKCPLLFSARIAWGEGTIPAKDDCLKEKCAWWIPAFGVCPILEIAIRLGSLADNVFSIKDEMTEGKK